MIVFYNDDKILEIYGVSKDKLKASLLAEEVDGEKLYENEESLRFVLNSNAEFLEERKKELKGFIISNIFLNEDIIKTMAVSYNITGDNETIEWIDIHNNIVTFSKDEFGALIKNGAQTVKEIYFKYRTLKDSAGV